MKKLNKSLTVLLALCLTLGMAFGATACTGGNSKTNNNVNVAVDCDGNTLNDKNVYAMPANLAFLTSADILDGTGSAGVTVRAAITPDNATNKAVDWSISWVNPSSAFANGKNVTSYVSVTPTANGSLTATVKCLQAFGEQINVTVTSRDNASATAACAVDYIKRITDVSVAFSATGLGDSAITLSSGNVPTVRFFLEHATNDNKKVPTVTPVYSSVYTVEDTCSVKISLRASGGFEQHCTDNEIDNLYGNRWDGSNVVDVSNGFFPGADIVKLIFADIQFQYSMLRGMLETCASPQLEFIVTLTGAYTTFTKTFTAKVDTANFKLPVSGLSLDAGQIVC